MGDKELQQTEFRGRQLYRAVIGQHTVGLGVEFDGADLDDVLVTYLTATPYHRPYPRQQFAGREGLGDEIVGAGIQPLDLVVFAAACGQHDDRDGAGFGVAFQAPREIDAADAGQHPVEQDEVRNHSAHGVVRFLDIAGLEEVVAVARQGKAQHLANGRFVFDDENISCHALLPRVRSLSLRDTSTLVL